MIDNVNSKVSGIILSGGQSSRMKANKAFTEVNGQKIVEIILRKMVKTFDEIQLVTNDPTAYAIYASQGVKVITDVIPGKGPLSGIHAGLARTDRDMVFSVACDMPFVSMGLARYMIGLAEGQDAVVPRIGDYFQPLCAVYSKKCMPMLERALLNDQLKISRLYEELNIRYVDEQAIRLFGDPALLFHNINSREDLALAHSMAVREVI